MQGNRVSRAPRRLTAVGAMVAAVAANCTRGPLPGGGDAGGAGGAAGMTRDASLSDTATGGNGGSGAGPTGGVGGGTGGFVASIPVEERFGEWRSEMATRKNPDGTVSFLTIAPGLSGFEFVVGSGAKRSLIARDAQHEYTFTET